MTKEKEEELLKKIPGHYRSFVERAGDSQRSALFKKIDEGYQIDLVGAHGGILVKQGFSYFWIFTWGAVTPA
jgi:hypothetical protein